MQPSEDTDHNSASLPVRVEELPEPIRKSVSTLQGRIADYLFQMSCLDGVVDFRRSLSLPREFLRLLQKVMELHDESVRFLLGHFRRCGVTTTCEPGCAYCCCHMPAGVSVVELLYVYHGMHLAGKPDIFFRRCLEVQEVWTELILHDVSSSEPAAAGSASRDILLTRYQFFGQPCPFLQQNHCQIYPFRPFACRMHFSMSPPYWCWPSHFQFPHAVRFNIEPGECVLEGLDRLDERLQIGLSDVLAPGLLELTINTMRFEQIRWMS